MPGNTACPTNPERGGITTSARPEARLNSVRDIGDAILRAKGEVLVDRQRRRPIPASPRTIRMSPAASAERRSGPP